MMRNSTNFLNVRYYYDPDGSYGRTEKFPEGVDTKSRIIVGVGDNRDVFSYKSGRALLDLFKMVLEFIYPHMKLGATDINTDIVAKFFDIKGFPLGYFYQGKYYLWEK